MEQIERHTQNHNRVSLISTLIMELAAWLPDTVEKVSLASRWPNIIIHRKR